MLNRTELEQAASVVGRQMQPTPQIRWPQLETGIGAEIWVKHENHTPIGAFKIRGGIVLVDWLRKNHPQTRGMVTATRGNHGQSVARAATAAGLTSRVVVPHGNSVEKNRAMAAFGAEVIVFGKDFDEARLEAHRMAADENLFFVPPFHPELVRGVATYAFELFSAQPDLDAVYVPIGCGSGICGLIHTRDAFGLQTRIIGVVAENANAARLSFEAGKPVPTNSAATFADGIAVRDPVPEALEIYGRGAERVVEVGESEIVEAIGLYFSATHNVAEGAGAAPLAALMKEADRMAGRKVALILSGGNIDTQWFTEVLAGRIPG